MQRIANPSVTRTIRSRLHQALGLAGWLLLCLAASAVGAFASADAGAFYASLTRPAWAPPAWLFGPVWSILFLAMAVSVWWLWRTIASPGAKSLAIRLFLAQLVANALWSWLFFAWRLGAAAFVEVLVLWVLIAATIASFWQVSRIAAMLLVPYLLWVTFAAGLNWTLWQANPQLLG